MATRTEELVAEETRRRPPVALVSAVAGLCFLISGILLRAALADQPEIQFVSALNESFAGDRRLKVQQTLYFDEKAVPLLISALLTSVAAAASGYVLAFLFRATKAREAAIPRIGIIATVIGAVCMAVGSAVAGVALFVEAASFADLDKPTFQDAEDVSESAVLIAGSAIQKVFGTLALALGFFFVCFNALKVGLLTRFMGFLGMIAGVMFVLPIIPGGLPMLQAVWLLLLAAVLLGTAVGGLPPAWVTGRAEPWPTQQELRERKEREARRGGGRAPAPVALDKPAAAPRPHSSSKKKRKKRR